MKYFLTTILFVLIFSTNFTFAANSFKQEMVCGIIGFKCAMDLINQYREIIFGPSSASVVDSTVVTQDKVNNQVNDLLKSPEKTNGNIDSVAVGEESKEEENTLGDEEHDHDHEEEVVAPEIPKDESFFCKLGLFCSNQKKDTLKESDLANSSTEEATQDPEELMSMYNSLDPNNQDYSNRGDSFYSSPAYQAMANAVDNDSSSVYGEQLPAKDLDQSKIDGAFIDPGSGDCGNYGITLSGSNSGRYKADTLSSKIKLDTKKLCSLTGKKLHVTSGRRAGLSESNGCYTQSQHNCGKAMDTEFVPFKSDEEKTIVMLYFMARGYNGIGSYGLTIPIHMDHRNAPMRWGPGPRQSNGKRPFKLMYCDERHWPNYAKQAFLRAKVDPCRLISTQTLSANAKAALIQMGKPQFAE